MSTDKKQALVISFFWLVAALIAWLLPLRGLLPESHLDVRPTCVSPQDLTYWYDVHVDPWRGNDWTADGSLARPFRTLEGTRDRLPPCCVRLVLAPGDHVMNKTMGLPPYAVIIGTEEMDHVFGFPVGRSGSIGPTVVAAGKK